MALGDGTDLLLESGDIVLLESGDSVQLEQQPVSNTPYRAICRRLPWMRRLTVIPDSTIGQADRQAIAFTYGGILAGEEAIATATTRWTVQGTQAIRRTLQSTKATRHTIEGV